MGSDDATAQRVEDRGVRVALLPGAGADVAAMVQRAGAVLDDTAAILLADAREGLSAVEDADERALRDRAALVALVATPAQVGAAYDAGATHVAIAAGALPDVLRFAGRHARRVRGDGRMRRLGDHGGDDLAGFVAAHDGAVAITVALTGIELVNAAYGRAAGDAVMAEAERRLRDALHDLPARVVRSGPGFAAAAAPASAGPPDQETVERLLRSPFILAGEPVHVGMRIGVAEARAAEPADALLRRAAAAASGVHVESPAGDPRRRDLLATDLGRALERREIDVLFQPQVSIATGRIAGVEALARWQHPVHGVLGAEELLAAAGRAGLGLALSDHIQALALTRVAAWPDALAGLRVAVNVTAADVARGDFARRFLQRVADSGVARARVTAEITEDGLIANLDAAAALLAQLRGAGCRVAIDDFGTGYSSLAYLKALPLDYLKVDRRLTQDITGDDRDRVVVRGVLAMARSLGLETIAEGVETPAQRDALSEERCTFYQGFLCAPPVDVATLVRLVEAGG